MPPIPSTFQQLKYSIRCQDYIADTKKLARTLTMRPKQIPHIDIRQGRYSEARVVHTSMAERLSCTNFNGFGCF